MVTFALIIEEAGASTCMSATFPRIMGGTNSNTEYSALDIDSNGNVSYFNE